VPDVPVRIVRLFLQLFYTGNVTVRGVRELRQVSIL
jgi:hypothetical protein